MEPSDGRLRTWAEIGAYIRRDARTAQRYERTAGLPVRRLAVTPGSPGSAVYALRSDLDVWLKAREREGTHSTIGFLPVAASAPPPRQTLRRAARAKWAEAAMVASAGVVVALCLAVTVLTLRSPARAAQPSPEARSLHEQGVYAWNRRTPEGLAQAVDAFMRAVVLDPQYADAYAGLADCYDLAPEFGNLKPAEAYPRAFAAASRAVELDPRSAQAHRALGFVDFWWRQDVLQGLNEMRASERLDPGSPLTHHWLANMLAVNHDLAALIEIDRALALDPSTSIMADKGFVLEMLGRYDEAAGVLTRVAQLSPTDATVHDYLTILGRRRGDEAAVLQESRIAAALRHDARSARAAGQAEQVLRAQGTKAALRRVASDQEQLLEAGQGDSFQAALAESDLRRRDLTLVLLTRARAEHSPALLSLATNPDFEWLHDDASFRRLLVPQGELSVSHGAG